MARMIRERAITSAELMSLHIVQIQEVNPALNAVVLPLFDSAMERARLADQQVKKGALLGPLHGVPFSVKDSINVQGARTTAGTWGLRAAPAAEADAVVVGRLRAAGAIPIAKTNLPDLLFAYESDNLIFGRTNNPYDLSRTSGGSSGGESALLAASGSPLGLGSDAAGSVRVPAAFCGVASLKPTSGRVPRTGHVPAAGGWLEALWQIGPMARCAEDLELALELLSGPDALDFTAPPAALDQARPVKGLRIAVLTDNGITPSNQWVRDVVLQAAGVLERSGAQIEDVLPPGMNSAYRLEMALLGADGCCGFDSYVQAIGSTRLHPILLKGFLSRMRSQGRSVAELGELWAEWDTYRLRMEEFFSRYDAVLSPIYPDVALKHGESVLQESFEGFSYTMAWNVAGLPAATVRCGEHMGLPVNVQVVTGRWRDRLAILICKHLENELGGWRAPRMLERRQTKLETEPGRFSR